MIGGGKGRLSKGIEKSHKITRQRRGQAMTYQNQCYKRLKIRLDREKREYVSKKGVKRVEKAVGIRVV